MSTPGPCGGQASEAYLEICREMAVQPSQQFLEVLQSGSKICKLTNFDTDEQLYATVSLLPYANLEELDLSSLTLPLDGWCALLEACNRCQNLQVLSLKGCALGALGEDAQEKIAAHIGACGVVVLDVSQNSLGDGFVLALSQLPLLNGGDKLTVLDLSENCITDDALSVLASILEVDGLNCPLKQLDLSFNRLQDKGACALASVLSCVPLLALELEGNEIGDAGSLALASALKGALCLQRLNLNNNRFSSKALTAIAEALRTNTSALQELAVAGATGSEDGLAALLRAACSSKHLQLLDIRGLPVQAAGVDALCELLCSSAPLITMRLDVATKEAAESIAQALPRNSSLLHFMMGGPVPEHVLSFVAASLSSNTLSKLQQQQIASPGNSYGGSPQRTVLGTPAGQQRSPARPASAGANRGLSSSLRAAGSILGSAGGAKQTPPRPASAGSTLTRSGNYSTTVRSLVRTTTQQARHLATIDPTGLAGLTAGGVANKAAEVFRRHDSDNSGYLDAEEMMSALQDLGMLENMKARQLGKFLSNAIKEADTDQDGRVGLEDFIKYYERLARYYAEAARQGRITARRKPPAVPLDAPANDHLKRVFRSYCKLRIGQGRQVGASVQHINAAQFNQMCRDAGLLEPTGPLSQCAVDIVFTRCKPPGSRRLSFKEFLEAVASVAEEAGCGFDDICQAMEVISYSSPPMSRSVSPVATPGYITDTDFDPAGPGVIPSAVARGRLPVVTAAPRISDFSATGVKVGPVLPGRGFMSAPVSRHSLLGPGLESSLPVPSAAGMQWGSGAIYTSPAKSHLFTATHGAAAASSGGGSAAHSASPPTLKVARQSLSSPLATTSPEAGVRLPGAAVATGQLRQSSHAADALQNGSADAGVGIKAAVESRLKAIEGKMGLRGAAKSGSSISAGSEQGALMDRMLLIEEAVAEQQQQLAAVVGQQEALKEVVTKLVQSIEGLKANASAKQDLSAEVEELNQQVKLMAQDVGQLKGSSVSASSLTEKLQELSKRTEDRHVRAETAIYQVARQVDVLDARLKDEQESSLKALEALLANSPAVK